MLAPRWLTTAIFVLTCIQDSGSDSQKQPVCLARDWREAAAPLKWPMCVETRWDRRPNGEPTTTPTPVSHNNLKFTSGSSSASASITVESVSASSSADQELDTESPLDNVNFLSFEDWKKQNLAKAGQSAENIGGNRRAGTAEKDRRRPIGINNALDSLGDDVEIELDFGGFGADASEAAKTATDWVTHVPSRGSGGTQVIPDAGRDIVDTSGQGVPHAGGERSKDAGTTCKERFNYASFDCAATVLKTNPEAKGSSSVLIENKDSYMLNECRAQNKFLILELCDDILVDTVVLANYEFFSSIFHTFRVSVADRYPAKPEQWKELGIYEARNTREIQAFAVDNPLIWARYLRIEFLTHYGNEFYCPLSLIRVHGTTMLEEYKHDGEVNRAEEELAGGAAEPVSETETVTEDVTKTEVPPPEAPSFHVVNAEILPSKTCPNSVTGVELALLGSKDFQKCGINDTSEEALATDGNKPAFGKSSSSPVIPSAGNAAKAASPETGDYKISGSFGANPLNTVDAAASGAASSETDPQNATSDPDTRSTAASKDEQIVESIRVTTTQPPSANPTTQESFFKSVNKRLQMLETNSSLSLQYIEEQSRILRDAFNKVEKRQLSKTSTFLENLNVTVIHELKQLREQYDQVWRSVALEFEHQRIQYHQEIHSLSAQLGVLADEIVFQKRVAVIQSIVVLLCFGLVLFTRGAVGSYIDFPSVQNMVSRSYSLRPSSPILGFGSPPGSPGSTRPTSSYRTTAGHRRQVSQDSQDGSVSPTTYAPPTPNSDESRLGPDERGTTSPSPDGTRSLPEAAPPLLRSNSSPPDLNGENEGECEENHEDLDSDSECSGFETGGDDTLK
ncbi:UNC-like C-terminal-domain-containing protein [Aspergillus spinulosporus]